MTVKEALTDGKWMHGLHRITTEEQLDQFLVLWNSNQHVQLSNDRDVTRWTQTTDGLYSARSAYAAQFVGRIKQPELEMA